MGTHITIDPVTRIIDLITAPVSGLVSLDVAADIYNEAKDDWILDSELRKHRFPLREPITAIIRGVQVGPFVFVDNASGWRLRPYDQNHELSLNGDLFPLDEAIPLFLPRSTRTIVIFGYLSAKTQTALGVAAPAWTETESAQIRGVLGVDGDIVPTTVKPTMVDSILDEPLTGASHNIPTTMGRRIRDVSSQIITTGIAAGSGVGSNQIELNGDASVQDGAYDPAGIAIVGGTGYGQARLILEYGGVSRIATVDRNWKTLPDDTSEYVVFAHPGREHVNEGLAQAGTATTITLNTLASSFDNAYLHQAVFIRSGTGEDQVRCICGYNGTTKVATVGEDWDVIPDSSSAYVMLPARAYTLQAITAAILDAPQADHSLAGTVGGSINVAALKSALAAALAAIE